MNRALQYAKGPDEAATSVQAGIQSLTSLQDRKMNSTVDSTGPAGTPVPTIDSVHVGVFEMISLLEVLKDLSGGITFRTPDAVARENIARVQNIASIVVHYARHVEVKLDDLISGASA